MLMQRILDSGAKTFLLTNSDWWYTNKVRQIQFQNNFDQTWIYRVHHGKLCFFWIDRHKNASKTFSKFDFDILRLYIFCYCNQFFWFCSAYEKWMVCKFQHVKQKIAKMPQKPIKMLELWNELSFSVIFGSYGQKK